MRELKATNEITAQDYEITLRTLELGTALFQYYDSGLLAALTASQNDLKGHVAFKDALHSSIAQNLSTSVHPEFQKQFNKIRDRIRKVLDEGLGADVALESLRKLHANPAFRAQFDELREQIQVLVKRSQESVTQDRENNNRLYQRSYPVLWIVFLLSLAALFYDLQSLRRWVLLPIQSIIEVIEQVRWGNLSARCKINQPDEMGETGRTINRMVEELEQRRRERIEFIGSVAHDLGNPLTAISLTCEVSAKKVDRLSSPEFLTTINRIRNQVDRMRCLTQDLLQAAKDNRPIWSQQGSLFPLVDLIRETVEIFRETDSRHKYSILETEEKACIKADRRRIEQVLTNLLSNASKYSPAGTCIEVASGSHDSKAFFEIRDQGVGIPDKKKKTVFRAFNRLESGAQMSSGTGLGLVIVKDIVESHSGSISIIDRPQGGTIFRVELPLSSEQPNLHHSKST